MQCVGLCYVVWFVADTATMKARQSVHNATSAPYEGGVVEGLIELRHYEAARLLEETIQTRLKEGGRSRVEPSAAFACTLSGRESPASITSESESGVESSQRHSFVFSNDCKSDETAWMNTTSRSFRSKSPVPSGRTTPSYRRRSSITRYIMLLLSLLLLSLLLSLLIGCWCEFLLQEASNRHHVCDCMSSGSGQEHSHIP